MIAVVESAAAPTPIRRRPDCPRCAVPGHLVRLGEGLSRGGAGDQARHRHRIAADIENAAAGKIVGEKPMLRHEARHGKAEARLDHPHLADRAGLDQLDQLGRLRMQAIHERFAERRCRPCAPRGMIASASKAVSAIGFSTSTCLPASAALIAHSAWPGCGVAM